MMDIETERQHLRDQIGQHVDPQYQDGMSIAVPTGLKVYGVRVPRLREIARAWQRAHKEITREHLMVLVEVLWDEESREERKTHPDQVAGYLEDNQDVLATHVVREVNNKLRTGLKSG